MLERFEGGLKLICLVLGAVLLYEISQIILRVNPLAKLVIPEVPTLAAPTNAPPRDTNPFAGADSVGRGPNAVGGRGNAPAPAAGTGTNRALQQRGDGPVGTNFPPAPPLTARGSNLMVVVESMTSVTAAVTNAATGDRATNQPAAGTVRVARAAGRGRGAGPVELAMAMRGGGMPGGTPLPELPAPAKARVELIYRSELFGPVIQPIPSALLGIAGDSVFLRGTNGQTGAVKEGDSLGGVKVLKIGINRVLVEEGGQQKELTIFSGFGGTSLMPKTPDNPP